MKHVLAFAASDGIVDKNLMENFCGEDSSRKPTVSTPSRWLWRTCTMKSTPSSPIPTRHMFSPKKNAFSMPSWPSTASPRKMIGPSTGVMPDATLLPSASLHLLWLKEASFWCLLCHVLVQKLRPPSGPVLSFSGEQRAPLQLYLPIPFQTDLKGRPCTATIHRISIQDAVKIKQEFVMDSLPVCMIGISVWMLTLWVLISNSAWTVPRYITLNQSCLYHVDNPFPWMDLISLQGKCHRKTQRKS